jgi:hypothetical protein
MRNDGGCPPVDAPEEGPSLAVCLSGMIRAEVDGCRQRLSVRGDPSPNKRAGANLNPRLTLALVVPKSLTAPKGGVARPALCPGGEGNAQRAPTIKLWGSREWGKGRGQGQYHSASEK